ncbi:MAG: response regulator [Candidatus Omnitrophica bacterium]|nr:response regulator [Candidatus Omnitrophota bacterium]
MKKILIVDDEEKIRKIYKDLLIDKGYYVIEAANANIANEELLREEIDLVLLDIKMPKIDGGVMYDVIRMFHRKCKVIVTSVYPLDEQMKIIPEAEGYHDKSEGTEVLLAKVKILLEDGAPNKKRGFLCQENTPLAM